MSAVSVIRELEAAGVRLSRDEDDLIAEILPGASLEPFRDYIVANKPALLEALSHETAAADPLPTVPLTWAHVYRGPAEATVLSSEWDGTLPEACGWPKTCGVLGPCPRSLAGDPCRLGNL